jgi:hypothetical protein
LQIYKTAEKILFQEGDESDEDDPDFHEANYGARRGFKNLTLNGHAWSVPETIVELQHSFSGKTTI